jgi:hypothetical protein
MCSRLFFAVGLGTSLATGAVFAGTPTIEGIVKDSSGHTVKGASVWIQSNGPSKFSKVVKTDGNGRYLCPGLNTGSYRVAVLVNGSVKTAVVTAAAQPNKPTDVNFTVNERIHAGKTHMVWIPSETGSHIGRWVEVDENGNPVNTVSTIPTQRAAGNALSLGVGQSH